MVFRETFLPILLHILRHLILECSVQGMFMLREIFWCKKARGNPQLKVVINLPQPQTTTLSQPRDYNEVRQPEIYSTQWRG